MSRYAELRPEFFKALAVGQPAPHVIEQVPQTVLDKWTNRFYRVSRPSEVPRSPRLLNHFKLGADPEFSFLYGEKQMAASDYGLRAGLCFGADNNGRLVELRPKASTYAVEVVASILSELRWLAVMCPKVLSLTWKAGAFSGFDGLGGHVHFGRKRSKTSHFGKELPTLLKSEVLALDRINQLLHLVGIFSEEERVARLAKKYGQQSDWRPQVHGYEYRSFPSWLTSPWVTYLTIVLSKLAVLNPEMVAAIPVVKGQTQLARKQIRSLLAYFKGMDDDALLAYLGLDIWGFPQFQSGLVDFKELWGIRPFIKAADFTLPQVLPLAVAPSRRDLEDIYFHVLQGRPIYNAQPSEAQWPFRTVPKNFETYQGKIDTHLCPGLGELCWDLVRPKGVEFYISFVGDGHDNWPKQPQICVSPGVWQVLPEIRSQVTMRYDWGNTFTVGFNKTALNAANLPTSKAWLLNNGFPVARYDRAESLKFDRWTVKMSAKKQPISKVLFQGA